MTELKQFAAYRNRRNLTVTVMSFSYRWDSEDESEMVEDTSI